MKVTVGFSRHKGFAPMSSLIRWYMGTEFSHTYFKVQLQGLDTPSVLQATGKGVSMCSYSNFLAHNAVVREFSLEVSDALFYRIYNDFHLQAGTKYGYWQNLGILIARAFKLKINPFQDGIVCSEYVAYCLEDVFPNDWDSNKQDFNLVMPKAIYEYLTNKDIEV